MVRMPIRDWPPPTQPTRWGRSHPFACFRVLFGIAELGLHTRLTAPSWHNCTWESEMGLKAHGRSLVTHSWANCRGTEPQRQVSPQWNQESDRKLYSNVFPRHWGNSHSSQKLNFSRASPHLCLLSQHRHTMNFMPGAPQTPPKLPLKSQPGLQSSALLLSLCCCSALTNSAQPSSYP